jgi:triosephosphate isomerase
MTERKPFIAGNWKMNLDRQRAKELIRGISAGMDVAAEVDVLVAPPFTLLPAVSEAIGKSGILLGGQNMHPETSGAYTGEISGRMLLETGCTHVILGHSERRMLLQETNGFIDGKVKSAVALGLVPILCVGETLEQRESGRTFEIVQEQLEGSLKSLMGDPGLPASSILAYEPVWAIGTGKTATPQQAQEVHGFIRQWMGDRLGAETAGQVRILYGGSVKADNIVELMSRPDIDGALVGGASLEAESFLPIVRFHEG